MTRNYFVIIAAAALFCLLLIFVSLWQEIDTPVTKDPVMMPSISPFPVKIVGTGVVEAKSENIYVGSSLNRVVSEVLVKVGEKIEKDQLLFILENRDLVAALDLQKASYEIVLAKFQKLKSLPLPEDLEIAKAALNHAKIFLELSKMQNDRVLDLSDPRAISQEEKTRRLFSYKEAESKMQEAQAQYEKVKSGTTKYDLEIGELEIYQAQANVNQVKAEIDRTRIQSPIEGTVLQIKIHEGELPSLDPFRAPLMIIGDIDEFYLRVSINQFDIPSYLPEAVAIAFLQGNDKVQFPLEFIRVEPLLVDKRNLTNEIGEKVDTRVLHLIYRIKETDYPIYVGQQMDVFIQIPLNSKTIQEVSVVENE